MNCSLFTFWTRALAYGVLIFSLVGCENDDVDDSPLDKDVVFQSITGVPALIAFQTAAFPGAYPGGKDDYKLFFGAEEIAVDEVTNTQLKLIVPYGISIGSHPVKLIYKNKEHIIGSIAIKNWQTELPAEIGFFETQDQEYPIHLRDSMNNSLIPHVSGDGTIDRILFTSGDGTHSVIELNELGLPSILHNERETVIIDGYDVEKGTVNVAMFFNEDRDNVSYSYGIQLDKEAIETAITYRSQMSGGRIGGNGRTQSEVGDILGVVTTVFSITGCIASVPALLTPLSAPLGFALASANCGSAIYGAYKTYQSIVNGDDVTNAVDVANAVYGNTTALYHCAKLTTKPKDAQEIYDGFYGCYTLVLEAVKGIDYLYDQFKESNKAAIERHQAILSSGYGDIKVTLTWDSHADIDLWVTEPDGTTIKWDNPSSPNSGTLDLDDTDGFGPENIFWPANKAPLGSYNIHVHYYGIDGEVAPTTSYTVTVVNFGVSRSFTGSLNLEQVASVVAFEAGGWAGVNPGRIAAPTVIEFDTSKFAKKSTDKN